MALAIPIDEARVADFCRRWKIREMALFGSVLREDFGPKSDVDVLVSFAKDSPWSYWDWPETIEELESIFGRKVDLVLKEGLKNPFRRHEILRTAMVIHAA